MHNADLARGEPEVEGGPESLKRHMEWLYPDPSRPCVCAHTWTSSGSCYGIQMGKAWHRTTTEEWCYHHGTEAQKF
jgi:hypothetical protein